MRQQQEHEEQQQMEEQEMNFIPFSGEVWDRLSAINVNDNVSTKMNMRYLSWAWAWATLMDNYPDSYFTFREPTEISGGSMEVWVDVAVVGSGGSQIQRSMWLPVMDHKNKSIINPDSRAISDTRMRCLTKCLALFGLGHYIYAGEDLPQESASYVEGLQVSADAIIKGIATNDPSSACEAYRELDRDDQEALFKGTKRKGGFLSSSEKTEIKKMLFENPEVK